MKILDYIMLKHSLRKIVIGMVTSSYTFTRQTISRFHKFI